MARRQARCTITALLVLAAVLAVAGQPARPAAAATTIYVDITASGANDGTSWADAYTDLQSGLAIANNGDQVWVAAGVYTPTATTDRAISFALETGVAIYGGFAGWETSTAQRDIAGNPTALNGNIGDPGLATDNSYHVVNGGSVGPTAVVDGVIIRSGQADGTTPNDQGAGLYLPSGNPTITNVTFTANSAIYLGGGLYNDLGSPTLRNVTFFAN